MSKLEAAIAADIDGTDAYLVYGDWLQGQGDPRGELIALQAAATAKARKAEASLLARHETMFLLDGVAVEWHLGFWRSARILDNTKATLRKLVRHPSAKFLRRLSFGRTHGRRQVEYTPVVAQLAKQRWPHLRELDFGDFPDEEWQVAWTSVGKVAPLYKAFPQLARLRLFGNRLELGTITHAGLRELAISTEAPVAPVIAALNKAKLPNLERLVLDLAHEQLVLRGLFDGRFPALEHLGIHWIEMTNDDLVSLCTGKTLAGLRTLSLAASLTDAQLTVMLQHAAKFSHLTALDLSNNLLSNEGHARVAQYLSPGTRRASPSLRRRRTP